MVRAYIGLGANLGDAAGALRAAVMTLRQLPGSRVQEVSSLYRTAALDSDSGRSLPTGGGDYLNAVVALDTGLTAPDLLAQLQAIEQEAGRQRSYRNAPRTLDLDLLLYGDARIQSAQLTVPHPRMVLRAFVLVPLAEIAPQAVDARLLAEVQGQPIERVGSLGV